MSAAAASPRLTPGQRDLMLQLVFCGPLYGLKGKVLRSARQLETRGLVSVSRAKRALLTATGREAAERAGLTAGPAPRFTDNQTRFMEQALYYAYTWVSHDKLRTARQLERRGLVRVDGPDACYSFRAYITDAGRIAAGRASISSRGWNPYDPY